MLDEKILIGILGYIWQAEETVGSIWWLVSVFGAVECIGVGFGIVELLMGCGLGMCWVWGVGYGVRA